jgi:hypothetical protein
LPRADSYSDADFRHTDLVNLRRDAEGNAFLNQYAVVKDLEQGAFGKVGALRFCFLFV